MLSDFYLQKIAEEVEVPLQTVRNIEALLGRGHTVYFLSAYRKDACGNLGELAIEHIAERIQYFKELSDRVRSFFQKHGDDPRLTPELREHISCVLDNYTFFDLTAAFTHKSSQKVQEARARGLEPLVEYIRQQVRGNMPLLALAEQFTQTPEGILSPEEALEGAFEILVERLVTDTAVRQRVRKALVEEGKLSAFPTRLAEKKYERYQRYQDFSAPLKEISDFDFLSIMHGNRVGAVRVSLDLPPGRGAACILDGILKSDGDPELQEALRSAAEHAYTRVLHPHLEDEILTRHMMEAEQRCLMECREHVRNLFLAPAAGEMTVLGLEPEFNHGWALAVVSPEGTYLQGAVWPAVDKNNAADLEARVQLLGDFLAHNDVDAVAIAQRGSCRQIARLIYRIAQEREDVKAVPVFVEDVGTAIYAKSKEAEAELPGLDYGIRLAVSLARRFQEPIFELVKVKPRYLVENRAALEVLPKHLDQVLEKTIRACINKVRLNLNRAPRAALRYVSGLDDNLASAVVAAREQRGGFLSRQELLEVQGITPSVYTECAGFLYIPNGNNPLDATAVHPEAYPIVEQMAADLGVTVQRLIRNRALLARADLTRYATETLGPLGLEDIRQALLRPVEEARRRFRPPKFIRGIVDIQDLQEGMEGEGIVTHVTEFGAYVDLGIPVQGMVPRKEMAEYRVRRPSAFLKVGQVVRIKVIKVDPEKRRILLSMRDLAPPQRQRAPRDASREDTTRLVPAAERVSSGQETQEVSADSKPQESFARRKHEDGRERDKAPRRAKEGRPREKRVEADSLQETAEEAPRPARRKERRKPARPEFFSTHDETEPFNTILAEKLASLRDKLT